MVFLQDCMFPQSPPCRLSAKDGQGLPCVGSYPSPFSVPKAPQQHSSELAGSQRTGKELCIQLFCSISQRFRHPASCWASLFSSGLAFPKLLGVACSEGC